MLKHVRITNFKSLGDVSVELGPLAVLIGRSGTGKTNFVEALRYLRDYLIQRNDPFLNAAGGWSPILSATAERPMTLSFAVTFDAPGVTEDYQYILTFRQPPRQPQVLPVFHEEKLSLGRRVLFHQREGQWVDQPEVVDPPRPGGLMLGALTGFSEVTTAHLVLSSALGCYSFPDNVLLGPGTGPKPGETGLSDNGDNFLQAFNAIAVDLSAWRQRKEMLAALRSLNPAIKSVEPRMPSRNGLVVSHDVGGRLLVLELRQESEGFRRFLAHLLALYQMPPKQVLIFEEPEKGIHPGALAILAEEFNVCHAQGRGQVLLTTHSPELLNHFDPDVLRVVEMDNYQTRIGPVVPDQVESIREQLLQTGELLTVDPARLITALERSGGRSFTVKANDRFRRASASPTV